MRHSMSGLVARVRRVWLGAHLAAGGGVALVLLVGLVGILPVAGKVWTGQRDATSVIGELAGSFTAGQTFVAAYPGLTRVEVLLATYDRRVASPFVFHLRAAEADSDLVVRTVDAAQVGNNAYFQFQFPPIRDSAGRSFYFFLEAPQSKPGKALTIWGSGRDVYTDGEAVFQDMQGGGVRDLAFRAGYDPTLLERIVILFQRMTAAKPSLWGDRWWYVALAAAYLVLLYAVFFRVAQRFILAKARGET